MDLLEKTKEICRLYDIKPVRSRGQNFLIKEETYDQVVGHAGLIPDDVIMEVGPGLGFLTTKLAALAKRVIAVEIDRKLAGALKTVLAEKNIKNVEVVNQDILKFAGNFKLVNVKIVANLPYNITSIFLRQCLEAESKPKSMVLMLQKEVAERIAAGAGKMSLLAVSVQFYASAEIMTEVPKEFFWPKPEVDSAIVKIIPKQTAAAVNEKDFFRLVRFGFSARRKMLKNNLAAGFRIEQSEAGSRIKAAGFNEKIRAQELSVEDWLKLFTLLEKEPF